MRSIYRRAQAALIVAVAGAGMLAGAAHAQQCPPDCPKPQAPPAAPAPDPDAPKPGQADHTLLVLPVRAA